MARKVPVRFHDGCSVIEYVSRTPKELQTEIERVRRSRLEALRVLRRVKRIRHPAVLSARFQLIVCDTPQSADDMSPKQKAEELARMSRALELARDTLGRLSNSRVRWLEEARFVLAYGSTPRCRDRPASFGKKRRKKYEEELYGEDDLD